MIEYIHDLMCACCTSINRKDYKMEYVLIVILILSALFIIGAVLMQKSDSEGLSGAIAGGQETYYGKDKSAGKDRLLFKLTLIVSIVFAVAVLLAYFIQPDYANAHKLDLWKTNQYLSEYMSYFGKYSSTIN